MFRKMIYIGDFKNRAIYFDTEKQIPLEAPKSSLLDTQKSKNNWKYIIGIILMLIALRMIQTIFPILDPFHERYSLATVVYLVIIWGIVTAGFPMMMEKALYKNINIATPTTKQAFSSAVYGNLIWNNFSDKKITRKKKLWAWLLTLCLVVLSAAGFIVVGATIFNMIGRRIGSEIISISFLGILPGVSIFLVWQNNVIRWMHVVENYQKRKIKWSNKHE